MTKQSRNRRKERRETSAYFKEIIDSCDLLKTMTEDDFKRIDEEVKTHYSGQEYAALNLVERTKEEIQAIRNPAYEYLIP